MRIALTLVLLAACTPAPPEPLRYTVVRGDTLGEIATAHGVSVDQLRHWNQIQGDLIEVGQVIEVRIGAIPSPAQPAVPAARRANLGTHERSPPPPDEPQFVMPPEKACLPPPEFTEDADGMSTVASQGLTTRQVGAVIDRFLPRTTSCVVGSSGTITVDMRIACTGRVQSVVVHSSTGLPDAVLGCVANRLHYAAFPAHALPKGEEVRIPLTYAYTPYPDEPTAGP